MSDELVWLRKTLAVYPEMGIAAYIRSGTGYLGPNVEHANSVLTADAKKMSRAFGNRLKNRVGTVVTAPGSTSVETARCILEGAGISSDVLEVDPEIGDPSLYVTDLELAMSQVGGLPKEDAREALLSGILRDRRPWATSDVKLAARKIQEKLVMAIQPGKIAVFVAPSTAIAATVGIALGLEESIGYADCPIFLEGAVFAPSKNGSVWIQMGAHSGESIL